MRPVPPRIAAIMRETARDHEVLPEDLVSRSRYRVHVYARFDAMRRVRALSPRPSLKQIATWFNRVDHTSVLHALRHVEPKPLAARTVRYAHDDASWEAKWLAQP